MRSISARLAKIEAAQQRTEGVQVVRVYGEETPAEAWAIERPSQAAPGPKGLLVGIRIFSRTRAEAEAPE